MIPLDTVCLEDIVSRQRFNVTLRTLREARRLTQEQLAKKVGVSQGYLAHLESGGRTNPSLPLVRRLAKALRVKVGELLE